MHACTTHAPGTPSLPCPSLPSPAHHQASRLLHVLMGLEMPLVSLLAGMEQQGIALDASVLQAQRPALEAALARLDAAAVRLNGGRPFNFLNHDGHVSRLLYGPAAEGGLGLPVPACASWGRCACMCVCVCVHASIDRVRACIRILLPARLPHQNVSECM